MWYNEFAKYYNHFFVERGVIMNCKFCRKDIPDNSKFCPFCGHSLSLNEHLTNTNKTNGFDFNAILSNKYTKIGIIAVIAVIAVIGVMPSLTSSSSDSFTVELSELMSTSISGTNGKGYFGYSVNMDNAIYQHQDALLAQIQQKCLVDADSPECTELYGYYNGIDAAFETFSCKIDKELGTISNGDKITLTCTYDKDAFKEIGFKIKGEKLEFVAEGLPDGEEYSLFDNLTASWKWMTNYYTFDVSLNDERLADLYFSFTTPDDEGYITVTFRNTKEEILENYGLVITDESLEQKVYIGHYPDLVENVSPEIENEVIAIAEEKLKQCIEKCGWNLYSDDKTRVIHSYQFVEFFQSFSTLYATFDVFTTEGVAYYKHIPLRDLYLLDDGTLVDHGELSEYDLGCEVDIIEWN